MKRAMQWSASAILLSALGGMGGCARTAPAKPISSGLVYAPAADLEKPAAAAVGANSGAISVPDGSPKDEAATTVPAVKADWAPAAAEPAVTDEVPAATDPFSSASGVANGEFFTIGSVVAEVNGTPIYADQVLEAIRSPLAAKARELAPRPFKAAAEELISKRIDLLISTELEVAAAEQALSDDEKKLARMATERWRRDQITAAGGSLAMAKINSSANGFEFDRQVHEEYRHNLVSLYMQKRVYPKIQITAADMRAYYNQDREKEFTIADRVSFRLIKIDPRIRGSREIALNLIGDLRDKAVHHFDFAALAEQFNDESAFKGHLFEISRGAFAIKGVEEALWNLKAGEVTPILTLDGAYYIAKVESRTVGHVKPFGEESVQEKIHETLWARQFRVLHQQVIDHLKQEAIVRPDPNGVKTVLEMAMQQYPGWARGQTASLGSPAGETRQAGTAGELGG